MDVYFVLVSILCFHSTHAGWSKIKDWVDGIYPGTKWCGNGNDAKNYDDLGSKDKLDVCCRAHDKCPISLKALKSGYGLTNLWYHTRSDCSCENDFYACLKAVSGNQGSHANTVGTVYFQLLHPKCIKESHPKKCKKKFLGICYKWKTDTSKTEYKWNDGKYWVDLDIWDKIKDLF